LTATVTLLLASSVSLATSHNVAIVILGQASLAMLLLATCIHMASLLHDAIPSHIRSGVSSGVDTLTWITFLPIALLVGFISTHYGIYAAGWVMVAITMVSCLLLVTVAIRHEPNIKKAGTESRATTNADPVSAREPK